MVFFTVCAFVGLDTLGTVASNGAQGFLWLVVLALIFVAPYMLVMAEVGSGFTMESGPYELVKLAFGRLRGGIAAILYWVTNPFSGGRALACIATDSWRANVFDIGHGTLGDYIFKFIFIWISIGVAIVSLRYGKWIPNLGAFMRIIVLGFFSFTVILYGIEHGFAGFSAGDMSPTKAVFLALVPVLLFNYVGFGLQNAAAEEMDNPQHDVPVSVFRSGIIGVVLYVVPILGIILVLPVKDVTGIGGFIGAVTKAFSVYGGAAHSLLVFMTICFVGTLVTSGAVWMIGSDRIQAVAAYDGSFIPWFGVFNRTFGTPVRVNMMSGIVSTLFCFAAIAFFNSGSDSTFQIVLDIAISTTLISYVWIFPAALKLRFTHPDVERPYVVPGRYGMWIGALLITGWVVLGSFVAVFPGVLEKVFNVPYDFHDNWGVSRGKFEVYTFVSLGVIVLFGVIGYILGADVRREAVAAQVSDRAEPPELPPDIGELPA